MALSSTDLKEYVRLFCELAMQMRVDGATEDEVAKAMFGAGPKFALRELASTPPSTWWKYNL